MSPGFIPIISSYGNSKTDKPFFPTWPSTIQRIKEECLVKGPKSVVHDISSRVGGVESALAPGQLPRNEMQVVKQKRKIKTNNLSGVGVAADELFSIMQQAAHKTLLINLFVI